jgi:hypothetical protein
LAAAALSSSGFALAVLMGWARAGRGQVRAAELAAAPWYVLKKLPLYVAFLTRRQKEWVRTSRRP